MFFVQFPMSLSSNITSSLSLYWSCAEVCSRNAHSCHTVMSLKSLNPNLSWSSHSTGCLSSAGPAWSFLAHVFHGSWTPGRHEIGIRPPPRELGMRGVSIVRMSQWTLVFSWPQLGLISPVRFPSWSGHILGSGVELNQ